MSSAILTFSLTLCLFLVFNNHLYCILSYAFVTVHLYYIYSFCDISYKLGAPVAQWFKRWPTDLAVPGSSPV